MITVSAFTGVLVVRRFGCVPLRSKKLSVDEACLGMWSGYGSDVCCMICSDVSEYLGYAAV